MLGAERSDTSWSLGPAATKRWRQLGIRMNDIHLRKFSHSPEKGDGARLRPGGLDSRQETREAMALGLVEGTQVGHSFYNHSERNRTGTLLPPPSLSLLVHPRRTDGDRHNVLTDNEEGLGLAGRIWGPLGSLAGEVAATVKGSEAGEGVRSVPEQE